MIFVLWKWQLSVFERTKWRNHCAVGQSAVSVLQTVMNPPQSPHALVKMWVKMAVENDIPDCSRQTACSVENIQRITFLRTERDGIQNRGNRILRLQPPLMIVEMENMGFLYSAVYQTYL